MKNNILWFVFISTLLLSSCSSAKTSSAGMHVAQETVAVGGADGSGELISTEMKLVLPSQAV